MGETKAGGGLTCEGVDDEADDHGHHGDEDPVREALVLHAAVDGDGRLVALRHNVQRLWSLWTDCCRFHVKTSYTHLEPKADGRDDAEHGGPGAEPEHKQKFSSGRFSPVLLSGNK